MNNSQFQPPLNQIALSVIDIRRTELWFREGLGFLPSGGARHLMSTPIIGSVQGYPWVKSTAWWMVARNSWFQMELWQFQRPVSQLLPADFRPCDIGYTRMGVYVTDFSATLERLAKLDTQPLTEVLGQPGHRRACVRSPDGVFVEIMENDPLPQPPGSERDCTVAVRSVTISTPDINATTAYLQAVCGSAPESIELHRQEHEALWNLPEATCERVVFCAGDILVEVVQYHNPVGKPWPEGYRIFDQGILNIAFGARNREDHKQVYDRVYATGARPNCRPVHVPGSGVVYMNDALGFSVEILWMAQGRADRNWGFEPMPLESYPKPDNRRAEAMVTLSAPVGRVWEVLNDQNSMSEWLGFSSVTRVLDGVPEADGYGSERILQGGGMGKVNETITGVEHMRCIRYRVTRGSPFIFHNGIITLKPVGEKTEVTWTIRFRSRIPLLGRVFEGVANRKLKQMLEQGLAPYIENL